jgi:hypothetical protein
MLTTLRRPTKTTRPSAFARSIFPAPFIFTIAEITKERLNKKASGK